MSSHASSQMELSNIDSCVRIDGAMDGPLDGRAFEDDFSPNNFQHHKALTLSSVALMSDFKPLQGQRKPSSTDPQLLAKGLLQQPD